MKGAVLLVLMSELLLMVKGLATELLLVVDVVCILSIVEEVSVSLERVSVSLDIDILEELLASEVDS